MPWEWSFNKIEKKKVIGSLYGKIFEGKTQDNVFKLMGNTHTYTHTQSYTLIIYNITYQLPVPSANSSVKKYYNVYIYIYLK